MKELSRALGSGTLSALSMNSLVGELHKSESGSLIAHGGVRNALPDE